MVDVSSGIYLNSAASSYRFIRAAKSAPNSLAVLSFGARRPRKRVGAKQRPGSASLGSRQALPAIEKGAACSFFVLVSFAEGLPAVRHAEAAVRLCGKLDPFRLAVDIQVCDKIVRRIVLLPSRERVV
jgi:hypothetical protein